MFLLKRLVIQVIVETIVHELAKLSAWYLRGTSIDRFLVSNVHRLRRNILDYIDRDWIVEFRWLTVRSIAYSCILVAIVLGICLGLRKIKLKMKRALDTHLIRLVSTQLPVTKNKSVQSWKTAESETQTLEIKYATKQIQSIRLEKVSKINQYNFKKSTRTTFTLTEPILYCNKSTEKTVKCLERGTQWERVNDGLNVAVKQPIKNIKTDNEYNMLNVLLDWFECLLGLEY